MNERARLLRRALLLSHRRGGGGARAAAQPIAARPPASGTTSAAAHACPSGPLPAQIPPAPSARLLCRPGARSGGAFALSSTPGAAAAAFAAVGRGGGRAALSTTTAAAASEEETPTTTTPPPHKPIHHRHAYASHSASATLDGGNTRVVFETGRLARQAGGAALLRHGCPPASASASSSSAATTDPAAHHSQGTVVLATACMAEGRNPLPDADGPQLQVDVRERFYASGRLPTHRPDRREASASERELLAARCVDRALRPLFPPGALYEVQVTATVLAADGGTDSAVAAINAASAALALSEAPWSGPASAVRVAAVRGGGGGDGSGSGKGNDDNWDILVDPPAAAAVGGPLPRRAGPGAPWPMLTSGPLLMAAGAAASGPPGRHNHPHHNPPPPIPPTCGLLLTYAGTSRGDVLMLEAQGAPAPESVVVAALRRAEAEALLLAEAQLALVRRGGRPKARLPLVWPADDLTRAVEELARPELEAVFSSSSPQDGRGGSVGEKDPWGVVFWKTAKERRSAALGALQGKVMQGLAAQGLLPDAHSMPSASVAAASASGSRTHPPTLHSPADAARALDLLTSRVMREALLAGYGRGTGLVDPRSSAARPSAVLPPTDAPAAAPAAPAAAPAVPVGSRADGRHPWTLRYVASEVGVLPRVVHGSALFDRGDTQCLATATVAADRDAAQGESPHGRSPRRLMLHYSFPPFSVGEVGRMMGAPPNRREVGHGALAEKALAPLMPPSHVFPFCVRLSAETLSSSGSSSMAAVCAGSAAMRAAGVPLVDDVAGVSVGLVYERAPQLERGDKEWAGEAAAAYGRGGGGGAVLAPSSSSSASASATVADDDGDVSDDDVSDEGDDDSSDEANDENQDQQPEDEAEAGGGAPERALLNARLRAHRARHRLPPHPRYGRGLLLTDIEGLEDHHGDMDFKVAGTIRGGVTAIQLDTKLPGVPREALERALKGPALTARRTIALVNRRAQFQSRERLPPRAKPKHGTISIARELVPRLIGVGGCNLESIEAATGGRLAVAETGEIAIYAPTASQWDHAATACLEVEGGSVVEGGVYRVKVVRVVDYGCFVSLPSGMPALLHISELEHRRLRDVHEAVKEGEEFDVLCLGKDNKGMVQLSRRALMPRPPRAAGEGGGPGPAVAGSGGNGGNENAANSGSTQQSVWTLPSDREYTPEEAAAAAEAALGLKEEEEEEDDDEGEGESDKTTTKRRRRRRE